VAAAAGLDRGLLIGGDHILVWAQRSAVPAAGVQVQDPGGLGAEVRVADEDPRAVLPRLDRVLGQPPADRSGRDRLGDAPGDRLAGQFRAAPHRQRHAQFCRQLAGQRLDLGDLHGGEAGRPARPLAIGQARQPMGGEPAAPLAGGVGGDAKPSGDGGVGHPACCQQHDLGAQHLPVRGGLAAFLALEAMTITSGQHQLAGTGGGHGQAPLGGITSTTVRKLARSDAPGCAATLQAAR
jgi:hypothetical protein